MKMNTFVNMECLIHKLRSHGNSVNILSSSDEASPQKAMSQNLNALYGSHGESVNILSSSDATRPQKVMSCAKCRCEVIDLLSNGPSASDDVISYLERCFPFSWGEASQCQSLTCSHRYNHSYSLECESSELCGICPRVPQDVWYEVYPHFIRLLCPRYNSSRPTAGSLWYLLQENIGTLSDVLILTDETILDIFLQALATPNREPHVTMCRFARLLQDYLVEEWPYETQMRPLRTFKKGKGRSNKIEPKFLKVDQPRRARPNCVDRMAVDSIGRVSTRVLSYLRDEKRARSGESFETQFNVPGFAGLSDLFASGTSINDIVDAVEELRLNLEKGVEVNHHVTLDVSTVLKPLAGALVLSLLWLRPPTALKENKIALCGVIGTIGAVLVGDKIASRLKDMFNPAEEQAFSIDTKCVSQIVFTIMTLGLYTDNEWKDKFNSCFKLFNNQPRVMKSLQDNLTFVIDMLDKVYSFVRVDICGYDYDRLFTQCRQEVGEWLAKVEYYSSQQRKGKLLIDSINYDELRALETRGFELMKEYRAAGPDGRAHVDIIHDGRRLLEKILEPFKRAAFDKNQLHEKPFTVMLSGRSGVGKSAVTIPLIDSLLSRVLPEEDLLRFAKNNMDFVYSCAFETKYWDGYKDQFVCVFDDFLQTFDDKSDADCEAMKVIRASNVFPYLLHMASIDDKANHYFSSKMIFATTNNDNLQSSVLREPEALRRRFDVIASVYPKKEYCIDPNATLERRRLDSAKLRGFNTDVYEFHLKGGPKKDEDVGMYGYDEFVSLLVGQFKQHHVNNGGYLNEIREKRAKEIKAALKDFAVTDQMDYDDPEELGRRWWQAHTPQWFSPSRENPELGKGEIPFLNNIGRCGILPFFKGLWVNILRPVLLVSVGAYGLYKLFSSNMGKRTLKNVISLFSDKTDDGSHYLIPKELVDNYSDGHCFEDSELQSVGLIGGKLQHARTTVKQTVPLANIPMLQPQFRSICKTTDDVAGKVIKSNWYCFLTKEGTLVACGVFLKGEIFLMNAHYHGHFEKLKEKHEMFFLCKPADFFNGHWKEAHTGIMLSNMVSQSPTEDEYKRDLWIVKLTGVRPHADITKLFASECNFEVYGDKPFPTVGYYIRNSESACGIQPYLRSANRSTVTVDVSRDGNTKWSDYITTSTKTESGDCGSLVLLNEDWTAGGRIVGIHAGFNHQSSLAIAVVCTREFLQDQLKRFTRVSVQAQGVPFDSAMLFSMQINGASPHEYFPIGKSKLRRSPCYGLLGRSLKEPAKLRPDSVGNPMEKALLKYAQPNRQVDAQALKAAREHYGQTLNNIAWEKREIFSFEQAVAGIEGRPFVNRIARNTSAGYPYNLYVDKPGKWDIFGEEVDFDFNTKLALQLRKDVNEKENMLLYGERPLFFYADCLKDELRPIEKVDKRDTRMFTPCPLPYTILIKRYFGSFVEFYLENRVVNGAAIGINPISLEWNQLAKMLLSKGNNIIAGDFSKFDATQYSMILQEILEIVNSWYNDGHSEMRRLLWHDIWNSHHINSGVWFEWDHSNPSGNPLTTVINSIYVNIVLRMAWVVCMGGSVYSLSRFRTEVFLVAYGDDNLISVSKEALEFFNYRTIQIALRTFGLEYTDENKSAVLPICKRLEEVTFLKRGFRWNGKRWLAPLDWDTVRQMTYWYRHGPNVCQRIADNMCNSLSEATLHGKERFNEIFNVVEARLREEDIHLPSSDFEYYSDRLRLEWYDGATANEVVPGEIPVNVTGATLAVEDTKDPTYLSLPPGGSENSQVTGCAVQDKCIEPQINALAQINQQEMSLQTNSESNDSGMKLHSQGAINSAETSSATMHFTHGRGTVSYQPFDIMNLSNALFRQKETIVQDIRTFLAKPLEIKTFTWATTDVAGTTMSNLTIPFDSGMNSTVIFKEKLRGFMGFRATACLKFVASVNKFAQGRLLFHYIPGTPLKGASSGKMYLYNLQTRTQQPRVDLDIGIQTEADLKIPFVNAELFYNLVSGSNPWATLYTTVYSPLVGSGASIQVSMFLHFEDVEVMIPTSVTVQSGGRRKANLTEKEQASGPLSRRFDTFSEALKVASQIPELSSVAGTASWVSEVCGNVARAFGYSKPSDIDGSAVMSNLQQPNSLNFDGVNANIPLGMSCRQKIDVLPGFAGNDIDELSIKYICQRAAYFYDTTWSTTDPHNTLLFTVGVRPGAYYTPYTVGGRNCYTYAPVAYVQSIFGLWRGDLIFHFKFVKTQFHTGKLLIAFEPSNLHVGPMTVNDAAFVHSEVVDISEKSEFHFRVPFLALSPWLDSGENNGRISCIVLTPLNAPPSVSNSIQILCEVSGGENLEFAALRDACNVPVWNDDFTPQINEIDDMEGEENVVDIGNAKITKDIAAAEQYCIGEKITSLKQVLLRHCRVYLGSTGNVKSLQIGAYKAGGDFYSSVGGWVDNPLSRDPYSCFQAGYVLIRGGMSYIIQNTGDNVSTTTKSMRASFAYLDGPNTQIAATSSTNRFDFNTGTYINNAYVNPCLAITVPAWAPSHSRYAYTDYDNNPRSWISMEPRGTISFVNPSTSATIPQLANCTLLRAVTDDTSMGYFIGFPLVHWRSQWEGAANL